MSRTGAGEAKDYYAILGVGREADASEIAAAFHMLVRKYHPDICQDDAVPDRYIRDINEAYDVLSDVAKRRVYDGSHPSTIHIEVTSSAGGASSSGGVHESTPPPFGNQSSGADIVATLPITPEEARDGGRCELTITIPQACRVCEGRGPSQEACRECGGSGRIVTRRCVRLVIPAGTHSGDTIRLIGHGKTYGFGGQRGDVLLTAQIRPYW